MGFLGAVIGGVIGSMFGGFWGGVIGATVGIGIGGGEDDSAKHKDTKIRTESRAEDGLDFLSDLIALMAKIAKADGYVTQDEANFVTEIMNAWELPEEKKRRLRRVFNTSKNSHVPYQFYVKRLAYYYDFPLEIREDILQTLATFAIIDNNLTDAEQEILVSLERAFGLQGVLYAFFSEYRANAENVNSDDTLEQCYRTLGCKPDDSDDEVRKAYHRLCKKFHPDTLAGRNVDASVIENAKHKMQQINAAYDRIKESRA